VRRPSGSLTIPAGHVTLDPPISTVVGNPSAANPEARGDRVVIVPTAEGDARAQVRHQYISNVVVKRDSDGATLIEGTDYRVNTNVGQVIGLVAGVQDICHVSYTGHKHRYDLIWADPVTGALGVAKGTDRAEDPEMYKPAEPAGKVPLYLAYVTVHGVELIPICKFAGMTPIAYRGEAAMDLQEARKAIRRTLGRFARGLQTDLLTYGDSTGALRGPLVSQDIQLVPNVDRDVFLPTDGSFFMRLPDDTKAMLEAKGLMYIYNPDYDPVVAPGRIDPSAGTGVDGGVRFVKLGWTWRFRQAALDRYGLAEDRIRVFNMGVPGTTASNQVEVIGSNTVYHGSCTPRLNAAVQAVTLAGATNDNNGACHCAVVNFGMNDRSLPVLEEGMYRIASFFLDHGMEVIFLPCAQVSSYGGRFPDPMEWVRYHEAVARAARRAGNVAFVPTYPFVGPGQEGGAGMSRAQMSASNMVNHPGVYEYLKIYGPALEALVA